MKRCKSCGNHLVENSDREEVGEEEYVYCSFCTTPVTLEELDEAFADIQPLSDPFGGLICEEENPPVTVKPRVMPPPKPTVKLDLSVLQELIAKTKD